MTEAQELLTGVRRMAIELDALTRSREELFQSVAGAKSPKTRDPEMCVQFSRDTSDHMADVVAELSDLDREIAQIREILQADRARLRRMMKRIGRNKDVKNARDLEKILRLYYLSPFKIVRERGAERRELRTWFDVANIMCMTRDPVMKRKRILEEKVDELIASGM